MNFNKSLEIESDRELNFAEKSILHLNDYLINKSPDSFVDAMSECPVLLSDYLQGKGTDLDVEIYLKVKDKIRKKKIKKNINIIVYVPTF